MENMNPAFSDGNDDENDSNVDEILKPKFFLQITWAQILATLLVVSVVRILTKYFKKKLHERNVRKKILHRKAVNLSTKRRLKNSLNEDEEAQKRKESILSKPINQLLSELKDGTLTAVLVLHVYQLKALEEDEKTNCITDFIEEAQKWAEGLDKSPLPKGPLHGLPVSIKDNIHVKGYDCTMGLVNFLDKPLDQDANLIKLLKEAGAVPFVKTNIPQTLMCYNCVNPIFGMTVHPLDPLRTPGGSSGGEAALIAGGGSPLGFGSDIGGSGRIPAHFCGLYSLKPTFNRISPKSTREPLEGIQGLYATLTPIAKDVEAIVAVIRALLTEKMFNLDPEVVPIPFNEALFSSTHRLRIGYYTDDGFITPTPGCQRAVLEAKLALIGAGHELIPFTIPDPWNAYKLAIKLTLADGGESIKQCWENDLIEERLLLSARIAYLPAACRKFLGAIIKSVSQRGAIVVGETGSSGFELWKLMTLRRNYIQLFLTAWNEQNLDALIGPGFSYPAPPHKYPEKLLPNAFTTLLYNLLNFPVGAVPITKENEQDQLDLETYRQDDLAYKLTKQATHGALNMPLGIQVIALPWKEELILRIMSTMEKALKANYFSRDN